MPRKKTSRATPPADKPPKNTPTPVVSPAGTEPKATRVGVPDANATPPKRSPGRPPGSKNKTTKKQEVEREERERLHQMWTEQGEVLASKGAKLFDGLGEYLGRTLGDEWALTHAEKQSLAVGVGTLMAKYEPQWANEWREEINLGLIVATVVGARVLAYLAKADEKTKDVPAEDVSDEKPTDPSAAPAPATMSLVDGRKAATK